MCRNHQWIAASSRGCSSRQHVPASHTEIVEKKIWCIYKPTCTMHMFIYLLRACFVFSWRIKNCKVSKKSTAWEYCCNQIWFHFCCERKFKSSFTMKRIPKTVASLARERIIQYELMYYVHSSWYRISASVSRPCKYTTQWMLKSTVEFISRRKRIHLPKEDALKNSRVKFLLQYFKRFKS